MLIAHVLRNAALPIVTVIGYNLGILLAGSALIETVFSWPGWAGCCSNRSPNAITR